MELSDEELPRRGKGFSSVLVEPISLMLARNQTRSPGGQG